MPSLIERHSFAVYVSGIDLAGQYEDALYENGCDDATMVVRDGALHLDFERSAESFNDAVNSARRDIERAGGRVIKVEPIVG
jgi:hypothetical protein